MLEDISGGVARLDPPANNEAEVLTVGMKKNSSATVTWKINWNQAKQKQKCLQSKYVEVGGKDCRLLVYPFGELLHLVLAGCCSWKGLTSAP